MRPLSNYILEYWECVQRKFLTHFCWFYQFVSLSDLENTLGWFATKCAAAEIRISISKSEAIVVLLKGFLLLPPG